MASERDGAPRPPKPPFAASRVLKALPPKVLSQGRKLLWLEIYGLDRGAGGCFMGATPLARRLGVSTDQVEQDRRELLRLGLLRTVLRPGKRTSCWYPCVPATCIPMTETPEDQEVFQCAERLAHLLTGPAEQAQPVGSPATPLTGGAGSAGRPSSHRRTGGAHSAGLQQTDTPTTGVACSATTPPTGGADPTDHERTGGAGSAGGVPDWRSLLSPGGFQPLLRLEQLPTSEVGPVNPPDGRSELRRLTPAIGNGPRRPEGAPA